MRPPERLTHSVTFRSALIAVAAMMVPALSSTSARRFGLAVVAASVVGVPSAPAAAPAENNGTAIRPFQFHAPDEALADLRRRIAATRWPSRELVNVTLYWLTNTTVSSARLYWESKLAFFAPKHIAIPVAVTAFPDELYQAPRSWTERAYPKLIYYNKVDIGGHFAAWEQPQLFATEMRAAFKSLR